MSKPNIPEVDTALDSAFGADAVPILPDVAPFSPGEEPEKANIPPAPDAPPPAAPAPSPEPDYPASLPDPALASREAALTARELALSVRERRFSARERLLEQRLPLDLMEHFDFSSDAALERGIAVAVMAASSSRGAVPAAVPPASLPPFPRVASYADRVRLWQIDPQGYKLAIAETERQN